MKVSNSQKPSDAQDGVSRETLNKWQRDETSGRNTEDTHKHGDPKDAGKQAEG
jgi:hypothetical protein